MYHCLELVFVVQSMHRPDEEWTGKILSETMSDCVLLKKVKTAFFLLLTNLPTSNLFTYIYLYIN